MELNISIDAEKKTESKSQKMSLINFRISTVVVDILLKKKSYLLASLVLLNS